MTRSGDGVTAQWVTSSNNDSIWIGGPSGELFLVARTGDTIPVGSLGDKVIFGVSISPSGMGDRNELAWKADFTDGTSALFITAVPEPGVILLGVGAGVALVGGVYWRRRERQRALLAEVVAVDEE